jgi:hypothetical protein
MREERRGGKGKKEGGKKGRKGRKEGGKEGREGKEGRKEDNQVAGGLIATKREQGDPLRTGEAGEWPAAELQDILAILHIQNEILECIRPEGFCCPM